MIQDPLSFAGRTVIVTGGNGAIGQGIVEAFSRRDANVVIADVAPALRPLQSFGSGGLIDVRTDIGDRVSVDAMIAEAKAAFGRIDILVNNAGRGEGMARLLDVTAEQTAAMLRLNVLGTVNCTQAAVAEMVTTGGGSIVNVSSNAALSGMAGRNDPIYAGAKGFMNSFTKALAADLGASNIRVNTVSPGWIVPETGEATSAGSFWNTLPLMGTPDQANAAFEESLAGRGPGGAPSNPLGLPPLRRLGRPRDIAYACLYFASDAAAHTTGQILSIGGGDYMPS